MKIPSRRKPASGIFPARAAKPRDTITVLRTAGDAAAADEKCRHSGGTEGEKEVTIKHIATKQVETVNDSYGLRLIEQGKAVPAEKPKAEKRKRVSADAAE